MSLNLEEIETIRSQAIAQIQTLTANDGPTIMVDGAHVPWTPWLAALRQTIDWCDQKLADGDPYEVRSRAET